MKAQEGDAEEARSEEELLDWLKAHPGLKAGMLRLLELVKNEKGEVRREADAEERMIREIKGLGREVLQEWARSREEEASNRVEQDGAVRYKKSAPLAQ
jgi:hypothetical protein